MSKNKVITAIFENHANAATAIDAVTLKGIPESRISLIASDNFDREAFGVETHSKLAEGTAIGAGIGGGVGAVVAGLTLVGAVATGGAGLLAAGPLVAALAGAGAGAAGGSIIGGLVGLAIPEHEVKHYEDAIEKGAVLVGVECVSGEEEKFVKDIFERHDAEKVSHA